MDTIPAASAFFRLYILSVAVAVRIMKLMCPQQLTSRTQQIVLFGPEGLIPETHQLTGHMAFSFQRPCHGKPPAFPVGKRGEQVEKSAALSYGGHSACDRPFY